MFLAFLKFFYKCAEPLSICSIQFRLSACALKACDGVSCIIQAYVMTGEESQACIPRHCVREETFRTPVFAGIAAKVGADGGITEQQRRSPATAKRASITTVIQEFQLGLQCRQNGMVGTHKASLRLPLFVIAQRTRICDAHHPRAAPHAANLSSPGRRSSSNRIGAAAPHVTAITSLCDANRYGKDCAFQVEVNL